MKSDNLHNSLKLPKSTSWLYIFISFFFLASGILFYQIQKKDIFSNKASELVSVAELKVQQITEFRNERYSEARFLYGNQTFIRTVNNFIKNRDSLSLSHLWDWTKPILNNHSYHSVLIIDAERKENVIALGNPFKSSEDIESSIRNCITSEKIIFGEITSGKEDFIYLPVFVPLILKSAASARNIAVLVFIIDPYVSLYKLIQSMPQKTKTGEILIIKKEENNIVYLNELRFRKKSAIKFRLPLETENLPAAKALKGDQDVSEGIDYRGHKVLATGRLIPGSGWTLVVKIDSDEVFSGLRTRAILTFGITGILIILTGLFLLYLWSQKNISYYKSRINDLNTISRLNRVYKLLSNVEKAIVKNTEKEKLLEEACNIIFNEGEYSLCWIGLLNDGTGCIECIAECGTEKKYNEIIKFSLDEKIFSTTDRFISNDIWNDPLLEKWRGNVIPVQFKSMAIFPLVQKSRIAGTLNLFSEKTGFFMDDEIDLIHGLSKDLSYALDKLELEKNEEIIKKNLLEKDEKLVEQNKELADLNEKFVCTNESLKESNERIKRVNRELIIAREKAEESDRLKSAFLANMSHEIRTPMNAIIGFSELINNPKISREEIAEFTSIITLRSNELLHLINDIVDLSKIESNTATLYFETFSFHKFLDELYLIYSKRLKQLNKKQLNLICKKPPEQQHFLVITDKVKFRQIFTNLIENAIKFTKTGEISFGYTTHQGNKLECFVSDTGIGIDPKFHSEIFEMFKQADHKSTNYGGTGLGLAICKGNSQLLGGDIWVESGMEIGSTFHFSVNFKQEDSEYDNEKTELKEIQVQNKNILLIEDDPYSIEYLKKIISTDGFNLHIARSGKETQEFYKKLGEMDIILLDMRLPDANGLDLLKQIKTLRPGVPVIAQTAFAFEEDRKKCLAAGCDDYISKPFKKEKIIDIINLFTAT